MKVRLAILGDSDSHGYQDRVGIPPGPGVRGGRHRDLTLQWTEALARLRGDQLELGPIRACGARRRIARVARLFGVALRTPRKRDHAHNFAFAGAGCADLVRGEDAQVPALLRLISEDVASWQAGVVVVRAGIVDLGGRSRLEELAEDPDGERGAPLVDGCVAHVRAAAAQLRAAQPGLKIALVGVLNNVDHPPQLERFRSPRQLRNIARALDRFDDGLRGVADGDPMVGFFDDRAWFRGRWGSRDEDGAPAYRGVRLGSHVVEHRAADDPLASVLSDGHAGLAWNLLWCQALTGWLARELGVPVNEVRDDELGRFFDEQIAHGGRG